MAPTLPQDLLGVVSFLLVKEPLTLGYPCLGAQEIPCRIRCAIYFAQKLHLPSLVRRVVASVLFPPPPPPIRSSPACDWPVQHFPQPPTPWAPTPCPLFFTPPQHHTWSLLSPGARLLPTWETCPSWHLKRTARVIAGAGIRSDRIPTHPVAEGSGCRIFFTRVSPMPPHLLHAHPGLE